MILKRFEQSMTTYPYAVFTFLAVKEKNEHISMLLELLAILDQLYIGWKEIILQ